MKIRCYRFVIVMVAAGSGMVVPTSSLAQSFSFSFPESVQQRVAEEFEMQTLGGRQFWGDVQFFQRWRIQRNTFSGHYRLLDEQDRRHASGTLEDCRARLRELTQSQPRMSGHGVVLLHGLVRSSRSLYTLADSLRAEGYTVFPVEYPSLRQSIPETAAQLQGILQHLDGIEEISLVGHSMGGLVIRSWFAQFQDPRVKQVVMLGTPNYGAEMADLLKHSLLLRAIFGPGARQLVTDPRGLIPTLPVPPCRFAVIAGGLSNGRGWNPLIPGDDDGTVTVASVRLVGAADSSLVPVLHHALLGDAEVSRQVGRFLKTGRLREGVSAQPVTERTIVRSTPTAAVERP